MTSLTEVLDNIYTTTWQKMRANAIDNIFSARPFWYWMKEKGKLRKEEGGRWIGEPLIFDDNDNVTWIGKGGSTNLSDYEFLTTAQYLWRYITVPVIRFGVDDQQNRGKAQIINLLTAKLTNAKNSVINTLETQLAAGSGAASDAMDGLQLLVADDPTAAATIGGISQATNTWWRNQYKDMTGISFATAGIDWMRTMLNDCSNNAKMDTPDIILCDQTTYERYEDVNLGYYQITSNKLADAGFIQQQFKGIPMIWSPAITQRMYFLNTNYLSLVYDPSLFFTMTDWKAIPAQVNDRVAHITTALQFTTNRRMVQGVMHTLDTA